MKYIIESYIEDEIKKYKVVAGTDRPTLNFSGNQEICEGDDNLSFPIVELRISEVLPYNRSNKYPYVVENPIQLDSYNSLLSEQETLKSEILTEDYKHGNPLPKLKKLARLKQLELILASGKF